jgi:predicted DCC family thiol-disulfide oxidoreductase YuxK
MQEPGTYNHIILFDGVCNFCNSSINLVIAKDKRNLFRFAPLQSEIGQQLLKYYHIDSSKTDSVIYIENGKAYTRSSAALRVAKHMKGAYPLLFGLIIIPPFLRNLVYDYIARNRYKWFGKKDSCMIPTPEVRQKFISS